MCSAGRNLTEPATLRARVELFAADRKTLAPLGAAPFQDETAVFGAHPHQESVRLLAMARVGLKRALALHDIPSGENEPPMLANAFQECQSRRRCVRVCVLLRPLP